MDIVSEFVLGLAGSGWALVAIFVLTLVDAVFPLVPSESLVIGLAALAVGGAPAAVPYLTLLFVVAASAAWLGDQLAYALGSRVGLTRFGWMQRPWFVQATARARDALNRRASTAVVAGRFVPGLRVVVSLVAGAIGIPRTTFRLLDAVASVLWSGYAVVIGLAAGPLVAAHPLAGVAGSIAMGLLVGLALDRVLSRFLRAAARPAQSDSSTAPTPAGGSTRSSSISASKSSTDSYCR